MQINSPFNCNAVHILFEGWYVYFPLNWKDIKARQHFIYLHICIVLFVQANDPLPYMSFWGVMSYRADSYSHLYNEDTELSKVSICLYEYIMKLLPDVEQRLERR